MEAYIRVKAPKEYQDALIPKYPPGCRRIIIDRKSCFLLNKNAILNVCSAGYLECLSQPNVDICWDAIDRIVENGLLLKSGKLLELDVIVLGTGFELVCKLGFLWICANILIYIGCRSKRT